jgi:hypothetical protein
MILYFKPPPVDFDRDHIPHNATERRTFNRGQNPNVVAGFTSYPGSKLYF